MEQGLIMARIRPFKGLRPDRQLAEKVAALPYDVMSTDEARAMAVGNHFSFLHVSRPEIDLPADTDPHSDVVYAEGRENLHRLIRDGVLVQDESECYYVYRQIMGGIIQTGLVVCAAVDDYQDGTIKKHELTRADKEEDRVRHIDCLDANDEPVFLTCKEDTAIGRIIDEVTSTPAEYDFTTDDGVTHTLWLVNDLERIEALTTLFAAIPSLYVADGHHRSAAASRVRDMRKAANAHHTGSEEYNFFLTVIFPDNEMNIMPYNRVVKDLNGHTVAEFMARVAFRFDIAPAPVPAEPANRHEFGMFLGGKWYRLVPKQGMFDESDAVGRLDVSILQDNLLNQVLGIRNPRTDHRLYFVGGIRGMAELERLVNSGEFEVALLSIRPLLAN